MKKILMITRYFPPDTSGVGDNCALIADLLSNDFNVSVLTSHPQGEWGKINIEGPITDWSANGVENIVKTVCKINPDIIFIHYTAQMYNRWGMSPHVGKIVAEIKSRIKTKAAAVLHEMFPVYSIHPVQFLQSLIKRISLRLLLKHCDHVVVTLPSRAKRLEGLIKTGEKISTIPIPSNIPVIPISHNEKRTIRKKITGDNGILLTAFGTLQRDKLVELKVELLEFLNKKKLVAHLVFIGDMSQDPRRLKALKENIEKKNLASKVHFTGKISKERVSTILSSSHAYLFFQKDGINTRSSAAAAALSHSLPIIANRGTDTHWIAGDYPRLFLLDKPNLTENTVDNILKFIRTLPAPEDREALDFYETRMGPAVQREAYIKIIEKLC